MRKRHVYSKNLRDDFNALRIGSEFISGILVGLLVGYGVDRYFGSKPWGTIIFLLLGIAASFRFVYRAMSRAANQPLDSTDEPDK